jgi:hypothetical protein
MRMRSLDRRKFYVPTQEELLERRVQRDNDVLAALRAGRRTHAVAREFGLAPDEVREINQAERATRAAMKRALRLTRAVRLRKEAREARQAAAAWPPARIRNLLVKEFGVPDDRVADAALIAEVVTRREILRMPMADRKTVDAIAAFLASHGLALQG